MIIRKCSPLTRKINEMDLPITEEQVNRYMAGELVQNAFPNLNADQREFIKTGYTPEDWAKIFPPGEE